MISYKIIGFNAPTGQIEVEYGPNLSRMVIDVPIVNGLFISGEELIKYVEGMLPTWHFERLAQIEAGIPNVNEINQMVQEPTPVPVVEISPQEAETIANQKMWEQVDFEKKIARALVKFGVLTEDPTIIPVSAQ